ncbi:MAG TPA: dephospho-CoA kinase, partial [Gemmatimonadales bacterium]|nr:dephospho-CoA kinase [Gemmatimonadales bacterium]
MLNVALTGNVASGKSTVAALFAAWGATVIDADALVHELQRPGTGVYEAIVRRFGHRIVGPRGLLDRDALRARVLADPDARRDLEAIVHPAVARRREELVADARRRGAPVVVSDIPLLFEALDPAAFDAVVLVDAPAAVRRRRLVEERGLDPAEAERLMAAQLPSAAKRARSTWVIDNDGT